jgi:chaperonin cofactor prefoldin
MTDTCDELTEQVETLEAHVSELEEDLKRAQSLIEKLEANE